MELKHINNYSYHYKKSENDSKGTIVFIHGFATTSEYHLPFADKVKDYDYYAIELPGHGINKSSTKKDLSPIKFANHIVEWIKLMNFGEIYLIGHSMGGGIAGIVSTMIPDKVKKLIMVTPMNSSYSKKLFNVIKFNPKNNQETFEMQKMLYKNHNLHFEGVDDEKIKNETEYQLKYQANFRILLLKMCGLINHNILKKAEKKITTPTLLILGVADGIIDANSTEKHFSKKNNFTIMIFKESGHLPFIEETEKYYNTIMDFIDK